MKPIWNGQLWNTSNTKFRLEARCQAIYFHADYAIGGKGISKLDGKITDYLPDYPKTTGDRLRSITCLPTRPVFPIILRSFQFFLKQWARSLHTRWIRKEIFFSCRLSSNQVQVAYDNSGIFFC